MKNFSFLFQLILALAVGVLYVLHFTSQKSSAPAMPVIPANSKAATANQVYVNIDTLLEHYEFYQKIKSDFETRQRATMSDLEKKKNTLEKEYAEAQQQARGGNMTEAQMQETEEKLMRKQQELVDYKNGEEEKLAMENQKLNKDMYAKLSSYLSKMNSSTNYQFVFGYTKEGGILFANDSLNITRYVIEGLNNEYRDSKKN